jgi:hypothetical protein
MADARQVALPVAVLEDETGILPTSNSSQPLEEEALKFEDAKTAAITKDEEDQSKVLFEEYRRDGGRKAWSTVVAGFLFSELQQLAITAAASTAAEPFIPILPPTKVFICLGQPNSFGIFQAHYKFVTFPEASELVRRTPLPQPLSLNS